MKSIQCQKQQQQKGRKFTFHWLNKDRGQTTRVPPFGFNGVVVSESIFLFFVISVSLEPLLPGLASISAIVITVFPSPIASASIYKDNHVVRDQVQMIIALPNPKALKGNLTN